MSQVLFFIAAVGAITGAVGVIAVRNPFYSVLALVCHLISLAALFLLLRAEFVAAAQVVVYAGAVMVLYVFVVSYVGGSDEPLTTTAAPGALKAGAPVFAGALAIELCIALLGTGLKGISTRGAPYTPGFGSPAQIGDLLLTRFLLAFEVASFLLLIAAVGAVVLARRRDPTHLDDDPVAISVADLFRMPPSAGTMAEGVHSSAANGAPAAAPHAPAGDRAGGHR